MENIVGTTLNKLRRETDTPKNKFLIIWELLKATFPK